MSSIRINSIAIENYRSFGSSQIITFPHSSFKKPISIIGYNNAGKTTVINSILYTIGEKYVTRDSFSIHDFHDMDINNIPSMILDVSSSTEQKKDGKKAVLEGTHKLELSVNLHDVDGAKIESYSRSLNQYGLQDRNYQAFGAHKSFNIFYINFHQIKEEISTKRTSWGNLKSFLGKHIKKLVDNDGTMSSKRKQYEDDLKKATNTVLTDSQLDKFIEVIKEEYSKNLRNNNCHIEFGLPSFEDIFLQMVFKIGLHGSTTNLIPIDQFGDGYISMFVMAVIQAIAKFNSSDSCLFIFEEPESFLHENHQEYFYKNVLCELAEKEHQVIYTTHSDKMVDIFDTQSIIRLEYDEDSRQTFVKYNEIDSTPNVNSSIQPVHPIKDYNQFLKSIEPNLNKILFSKKVILLEGPNDLMTYKYIVEKYLVDKGYSKVQAETYLNFLNIAFVVHHGKSTALVVAELCRHFGVEYFLINDWDLKDNFVKKLAESSDYKTIEEYTDGTSTVKGCITNNWNLIKSVGIDKIHFNIPKLESVIKYDNNDKDSFGIWQKLQQITAIKEDILPEKLRIFLELDTINNHTKDEELILIEGEAGQIDLYDSQIGAPSLSSDTEDMDEDLPF